MKHVYLVVLRDGTKEVFADAVTIMDNGALVFWKQSPKQAIVAINFGNWVLVEKARDNI